MKEDHKNFSFRGIFLNKKSSERISIKPCTFNPDYCSESTAFGLLKI
jgi:hypothetical protein